MWRITVVYEKCGEGAFIRGGHLFENIWYLELAEIKKKQKQKQKQKKTKQKKKKTLFIEKY